jgi:hypothetical protein
MLMILAGIKAGGLGWALSDCHSFSLTVLIIHIFFIG